MLTSPPLIRPSVHLFVSSAIIARVAVPCCTTAAAIVVYSVYCVNVCVAHVMQSSCQCVLTSLQLPVTSKRRQPEQISRKETRTVCEGVGRRTGEGVGGGTPRIETVVLSLRNQLTSGITSFFFFCFFSSFTKRREGPILELLGQNNDTSSSGQLIQSSKRHAYCRCSRRNYST